MPKAERELLAETEQLAAAGRYFALTRDLLCAASPDGWFQQCNAAWTQVLGWSDAELRSRRIIEFVHPDDRDAMRLDTAPLQNRGGTAAFVSRCAL